MEDRDPGQRAHRGMDVEALRASLQVSSGAPVSLVETHLSWVLLTADLAYKLKKAVRLPFVDCSTVALREHLCMEEVRLNRRLAPALYLGVLPVRGTRDAPSIGGSGTPIDFVVCMRRLAPGSLASEMLQSDSLATAELATFALRLARFHAQAPRAATDIPEDTPARAHAVVAGVLNALQATAPAKDMQDLRMWIEQQAATLVPLWQARWRDGHVRECHGDLHLDNLALIDGALTAFDCLEFDEGLRNIDTMCDIAFITMDLKARGRPDLAHAFLDDYLQASGDYAGVAVLGFYEVDRALVRAMVDGLRRACGAAAAQDSPYLAWALRTVRTPRANPVLVLMHGVSGSGKSTVARALVTQGDAIRLRSDVERKRLFGLDPLASSDGVGAEIYGDHSSERTYGHLLATARQLLGGGRAVIVDAAFLEHVQRQPFHALASELGVPLAIVHCDAPGAVLRSRLLSRAASGADPSEADARVLEGQFARLQPLLPQEQSNTVWVGADVVLDATAVWRQIAQRATQTRAS